ncbi:MAG: alsS, partial [Mycobacterium sp.]|uniref:acetolactate synthase AlsS n=1 Tax=Mycobacterium sp. TaxID=1785 RepID=UPI002610875C
LIVCRHEQNAAFMAAGIGRLTGTPGVVLVTSGPGTTNLATGLVTANTEGDPVVALCGAVTLPDRLKRTHQSMDAVSMFTPITKFAGEVNDTANVPEVVTNAFRKACGPAGGASVVVLPQDVAAGSATVALPAAGPSLVPAMGAAPAEAVDRAVQMLRGARLPVLLLGVRAGDVDATAAIRQLLARTDLPVVETYQAAGALSRELEDHFVGRIGLFRNQPGDVLLAHADVILTIGYDPVEYDPKLWNVAPGAQLIHLDALPAEIDNTYQPALELWGDVVQTVNALAARLGELKLSAQSSSLVTDLRGRLLELEEMPYRELPDRVHPLRIVRALRGLLADDTIVTCDVGSHAIWMSRHFRSYQPRTLLISNGQQTLGVALPWAIAATLVHPEKTVVSMSGDGGFLFSAMELETAVRLKSNLVHLVWRDGTYDMVAFQEQAKYGRTSGVEFGPVDTVTFAESFGATGLRVSSPDDFELVLKQAIDTPGPVIVDVPVDYSDNHTLGALVHQDVPA